MRKLRMIVFDDEEVILRLFKDYFPERDYEVITSQKPIECPIHDARRNACPKAYACADVFITDFRMQGTNGLQVIREQLRMGCIMEARNKALITGMYSDELKFEIDKLGCVLFEKPLRFSGMKAWVEECGKRVDLTKPLGTLRNEPRKPTPREIAHMTEDTGNLLEAFVVNRSNSGICLELRSPLARDERLRIDSGLFSPPRDGTVRWVREIGTGRYLAGMQYSTDIKS